mgnify:CR=1 FL=1
MNEQARSFLAALRRLDTLPNRLDETLDFAWDFGSGCVAIEALPKGERTWAKPYCGTFGCAIGLALVSGYTKSSEPKSIANIFNVDYASETTSFAELLRILTKPTYYGHGKGWDDITPGMVADALEDWYARHEASLDTEKS